MPARLRALAAILRVLEWVGFHKWMILLVIAGVTTYAYFVQRAPVAVAAWSLLAAAILSFTVYGEFVDYTIFVGQPFTGTARNDPPPAFQPGIATGTFTVWDRFRWQPPGTEYGQYVQVRWMADEKPPFLAVLRPTDLPESLPNPVEEADEISLWYPGVKVATGTAIMRGKILPAVRLEFIGTRLVLAVASEEAAQRIAAALRTA